MRVIYFLLNRDGTLGWEASTPTNKSKYLLSSPSRLSTRLSRMYYLTWSRFTLAFRRAILVIRNRKKQLLFFQFRNRLTAPHSIYAAKMTLNVSASAISGKGLVLPKDASSVSPDNPLLIIPSPLVAIPDDKHLDSTCAWCMLYRPKDDEGDDPVESALDLKLCTGCRVVRYCSKARFLFPTHKIEADTFVRNANPKHGKPTTSSNVPASKPYILAFSLQVCGRVSGFYFYKNVCPLGSGPQSSLLRAMFTNMSPQPPWTKSPK